MIDRLPRVVRELGARRALLVCGTTSFEASGAARVLSPLDDTVDLVRWSDFSPNTDIVDLQKGVEVLRGHAPDVVIGVGGGSTMDMAKLLCAFETVGPADLEGAVTNAGTIEDRSPHLVLAPTTSGSGSEATHFAVVYVGADKHSIAGPAMYADHVLLDPDLGRSGSPYQRATSGIDATCQAIESLWAVNATPISRRYARHALGLLVHNIEEFVHHDTDTTARAMSLGSHLAGRAIDISKTTAAHALSYGITKRYGVSHGNAVALTLGHFIETHASAKPSRLRASVDPAELGAAMQIILAQLGATDGATACQSFVRLLCRLGLAATLREVGLADESEHHALASSVNTSRLENNPIALERDDLIRILSDST